MSPYLPSDAPSSPVLWRDDGMPGSALYGDVYFSSQDGLAETRAVFLAGCNLRAAWAGRRHFTVAELGFGTGLNIAALLMLWRETAPADAWLHIFSVEAHPMSAADAARALGHWPEIAPAAEALTAAWPGQARGFHRLDLPAFNATLDLAVMDAADALNQWDGKADAWFLDGFAPAANPAMWAETLMAQVATHSAPGARAATFTVAGLVRRGLAAAGFAVFKQPGFGRKKERLEAHWPGQAADPPAPGPIAILGAGIAGASLARALRAQGLAVRVFDPAGPAAGASGNAAALMTPRLDAGDGPAPRLYAQAFRQARRAYAAQPGAVLAKSARHLAENDKDIRRFRIISGENLFEPGEMLADDDQMLMTTTQVLDPQAIVPAWVGAVETIAVAALTRLPTGLWRLTDADGRTLMDAAAVVLCAGPATAAFAPDLPIRPVRGQASFAAGARIDLATSFGAYAIPANGGVLFGATHQRGDTATEPRPEDDAANLAAIAARLPDLAAQLVDSPITGRAAVRATTPDHLPLAGAIPDQPGLYCLSGLGGRGFCLAPLLADHLTAQLTGAASPLPADLAEAIDPGRFARRAARRAPSSSKNAK